MVIMQVACDNDDVETTLPGRWNKEGEIQMGRNSSMYKNEGVSFKIGNEVFIGVGDWFLCMTMEPDEMKLVDKFPGIARKGAVAFVIGNKAYVGLGYSEEGDEKTYYDDFWVYDGENHRWESEPLAFPFPGNVRGNAVAFCLEGTAYVGTGEYNGNALKDFYSFEPARGWKEFTNLKHAFCGAVAFVADGCAYVCTGGESIPQSPGYDINYSLFMGMYKLSPDSSEWETLGPFDGKEGALDIRRIYTSCFVLNRGGKDYAYIVSGLNEYDKTISSCMEYNPRKERWQEVAYLPEPTARGVAFTFDGKKGFVTVDRERGEVNWLWKFER